MPDPTPMNAAELSESRQRCEAAQSPSLPDRIAATVSDATVTALKDELEQLTEENDRLSHDLDAAEQRVAAAQAEVERLRKRARELESANAGLVALAKAFPGYPPEVSPLNAAGTLLRWGDRVCSAIDAARTSQGSTHEVHD